MLKHLNLSISVTARFMKTLKVTEIEVCLVLLVMNTITIKIPIQGKEIELMIITVKRETMTTIMEIREIQEDHMIIVPKVVKETEITIIGVTETIVVMITMIQGEKRAHLITAQEVIMMILMSMILSGMALMIMMEESHLHMAIIIEITGQGAIQKVVTVILMMTIMGREIQLSTTLEMRMMPRQGMDVGGVVISRSLHG